MALGFIFIPFYLKYLGVEAYGLVGVFTALQNVFGLLDLGMGFTLTRELARLSARDGTDTRQRDLLRTLELIYWALSAAAGIAIVLLAGPIGAHWIRADTLSADTITRAVRLMGIAVTLQLPFSLYQAGLMGLQRQVLVSAILAGFGTIRSGGALLVLWAYPGSVDAFFVWQIVVTAVQSVVTAVALWAHVGGTTTATFQSSVLRDVGSFSAAISANALISALVTQLDKILLSRMLSLTDFGYYTLAGTLASGLWAIIIPINTAVTPRFSQLVEIGDTSALATLYHRACQLLAVALVPAAVTAILFSRELLALWTRNSVAATNASTIASLLLLGTTINGLISVPSYLQFAAGWPRLVLTYNAVSVLVLVPMLLFMASHFGGAGAATVWVALNCGYLFTTVPLMHRRLLPGHRLRWYRDDFARPVLAAAVVGTLLRFEMPKQLNAWPQAFYLGFVGIVLTVVVGTVLPAIREMAALRLRALRNAYVA